MKTVVLGVSAWVLAVIVGFVGMLAIGLVGVYGFGWFVDHTADRSGKTQVKQNINGNGQYRIGAYNHFYDLCASVQTKEASIANLQQELKTTADPQQKLQIPTDIVALQNARADAINQYNADAHKSYTLGQFRASDLPFQLSLVEDHTQCTP